MFFFVFQLESYAIERKSFCYQLPLVCCKLLHVHMLSYKSSFAWCVWMREKLNLCMFWLQMIVHGTSTLPFTIRCRGLKPLPNDLYVLRSHCHARTSAPRPVAAMSGAYVAHHLAATHFLVLVPRPQRHQSLTPTLASMVPSLHVQSCNGCLPFSTTLL